MRRKYARCRPPTLRRLHLAHDLPSASPQPASTTSSHINVCPAVRWAKPLRTLFQLDRTPGCRCRSSKRDASRRADVLRPVDWRDVHLCHASRMIRANCPTGTSSTVRGSVSSVTFAVASRATSRARRSNVASPASPTTRTRVCRAIAHRIMCLFADEMAIRIRRRAFPNVRVSKMPILSLARVVMRTYVTMSNAPHTQNVWKIVRFAYR